MKVVFEKTLEYIHFIFFFRESSGSGLGKFFLVLARFLLGWVVLYWRWECGSTVCAKSIGLWKLWRLSRVHGDITVVVFSLRCNVLREQMSTDFYLHIELNTYCGKPSTYTRYWGWIRRMRPGDRLISSLHTGPS